jgi:HK97 gp10 family phage protein
MIEVKGTVKGGAELSKMLAALPGIAQERVVLASLRAAGRTVAKDFKAATPVAPEGERSPKSIEYGHARDNVIARRQRRRLAVRVSWGAAFWMRLYEFGTSHQKPRPIFRPLWDGNVNAYLGALVKAMALGIRREAKKLDQRYNKARKALGARGRSIF